MVNILYIITTNSSHFRKWIWINFVGFFIAFSGISAQPQQQVRFNNLNHIKNIPTQEVFCMVKDRMGFLWIGSTDGLHKLDATDNIQVFKRDQPIIEGGLSSSAIRALYVDSKDNLWVGTTGGGLTRYHQPTNQWTVQSFSQLLEKSLENKLNKKEQEFMSFITSGVKSMKELVNSLLTFSRVNSRNGELVSIQLPRLLEQLQLELNAAIQEQNAQIILENIPPTIIGDRIKIKQLFQNLLTNAIKFTKPDQSPFITISTTQSDTHWTFRVKDNGIGIDPEFQEKIFQIFQRLHTKDKYEGIGIGLALCKKIVEQHKGTITVESAAGEGSCFIFTIDKRLVLETNVESVKTMEV